MTAGQTYKFGFEVGYGLLGRKIATSLLISANSAPINGDFSVLPPSGQELGTLFAFSAANWEDDDLPLTYSIAYTVAGNSVKIKPKGESQSYSSLLPAGPSPTNRLTLVLSVWDAYDTAATVAADVYVTAQVLNSSEVMSILTAALNVGSEGVGSVPSTCTTIGPKVVSSNLTTDELSSAYSSVLDGLSRYSALDPASDYDSTADCLQVFSASLGEVKAEARKSTLSLVSLLTASSQNIDSDFGGKLLGSIGSVMNRSAEGEVGLKEVEGTIESIGNSIMAHSIPGESVSILQGGISARLEMRWSEDLNGAIVGLSEGNASFSLPANLTLEAGLLPEAVYQLAAYTLPGSSVNSTVLKLDLAAVGEVDSPPLSLTVANLSSPITFSIHVPDLPQNATLQQVTCSYYIAANNSWSSAGVVAVSVNTTTRTITCNTTHLSVFSAGINSAIDTGEDNNLGELVNIGNLGNLSEKNAAGIYVCSALWCFYIAIGIYALILDRRSRNQALMDHQRKAVQEPTVSTLQTSSLFLKQLQAKAAKGTGISQGDTLQADISSAEADVSVTSRSVTETHVPEGDLKAKSV